MCVDTPASTPGNQSAQTVESFIGLASKGFFEGQAFHRIISGFVIQGGEAGRRAPCVGPWWHLSYRPAPIAGDPNSKVGYSDKGSLEGADVAAVRKWGTGGPGYNLPAEFNDRKHEFGVLSMARGADINSAGSQFFVCLGTLPSLDGKYTTFGRLVAGDDVLRKLGAAKTVRGDYPVQRQGIERVRVLG